MGIDNKDETSLQEVNETCKPQSRSTQKEIYTYSHHLFSHKELINKRGRQRLTIGNTLLLFYKKIETSKGLSPLKSHSFVLYRDISI